MTRRSESISASSRLRRPSVAASLTPSFHSGRALHRRASAIGAAEEGHDDAAAAATDALHEEIDEIKRYEVRKLLSSYLQCNKETNTDPGLYHYRYTAIASLTPCGLQVANIRNTRLGTRCSSRTITKESAAAREVGFLRKRRRNRLATEGL